MRRIKEEKQCKTKMEDISFMEALHTIALERERLESKSKDHRCRIEDLVPVADRLGIDKEDLPWLVTI